MLLYCVFCTSDNKPILNLNLNLNEEMMSARGTAGRHRWNREIADDPVVWYNITKNIPDSKVHGANIGSIWGQQELCYMGKYHIDDRFQRYQIYIPYHGGQNINPGNKNSWLVQGRVPQHKDSGEILHVDAEIHQYMSYMCMVITTI